MKDSIKIRFQAAVIAKDSGDLKTAREILSLVTFEDSNSSAILAVLADTHWELGDLEAAVDCFRKACKITPTLEAVSLGLFHCLWKLQRFDEAFEEVKRFQSISDSKDYREIIEEINKKL
jgi:tetratricopeptide (TPR) repeat protein